ncbi:MAG: ATP-binding protein [Desulfobulbaceae bacterium]|nr:ATP-binding protein [Desulfobulbaceae bacterium]
MKLIARNLTKHIQHSLKTDRVGAIMGPRQAGKTTLVRHLLKSERPLQYYNLKDPDIRRSLKASARQEFQFFKNSLIVLDEVQLMPVLLELIQLQVDTYPMVKGQFLILGSNHLLLNRQIKESLAGRVMLHTLYPLSFAEMAGSSTGSLLSRLLRSSSVTEAETSLTDFYLPAGHAADLAAKFANFILFGGYPEFLTRRRSEDRKRWLNSYHQTYLETDLRELAHLRNQESFERFEQLFAGRVAGLLNISGLARDCGLAADTIRRFMNYYRQLFVAWPVLPFHANIGKRMMKMPKWYFIDTGLLRSILNDFRPDSGELFENTILSELLKGIYLETQRSDLFFARTATGVEVDAVFSNLQGNITFFAEVKQGGTAHKADIRHLKKFVSMFANSVGLLINSTDSTRKLDERVWNVPAHWLLS